MTTLDLIQYYIDLLIIQYATQPNAMATIGAFMGTLIQNQIVAQVGDGFNFAVNPVGPTVDSAVGVQLEAIAAYRGAQRVVFGLSNNDYFVLSDAADGTTPDANGFVDAADLPPASVTWLFLTAEDTNAPLYSMTDDQLYRLTQLRAQVQSSGTTLSEIDAIMETFFGDNVAMLDNENMTITYVDLLSDTDPLFGIAVLTKSLPRPSGVLLWAFRADLFTDFFGLQDAAVAYDPAFAGFSDALTALTPGTFISAP